MPRVITCLCLRCANCVAVCPVDCISPGLPVDEYPSYYIDPDACIDCGACETECPNNAIYEAELVPADFVAAGGERISKPLGTPDFTDSYSSTDCNGNPIELKSTRIMEEGESLDLSESVAENAKFYLDGPGYTTQS